MSQSSGVFQFPSNAWWEFEWNWAGKTGGTAMDRLEATVYYSTNSGSSWNSLVFQNGNANFTDAWMGGLLKKSVKVTDYTTFRLQFLFYTSDANGTAWNGDTYNAIEFKKIGDIA